MNELGISGGDTCLHIIYLLFIGLFMEDFGYAIKGRIGEGAYGVVLKAKHIEVNKSTLSFYVEYISLIFSTTYCCLTTQLQMSLSNLTLNFTILQCK